MLLLKRSDWALVEVRDGLLKFKSTRYEDEYYMAKQAKLVDRNANEVSFLNVELPETFAKLLKSEQ